MSKINDLKQLVSNNSDDLEIGDLVLNFFSKEFKAEDYAHLFRQERWKEGIYCPFCQSNNIKKQPTSDRHIFKYLCLDCNSLFEDDTGSPLSGSNIPLQIWLQCWYLSQYCNSLQYIAEKLHLDINIIINMLNGLQHLFKAETILLKNKDHNDELLNNRSSSQQIYHEEKFKKFLILGGDTGKQPLDTAEYRRQKNNKQNNKFNQNKPNI